MVHTQYLGLPDGTLTMGTCAGLSERHAYARIGMIADAEANIPLPSKHGWIVRRSSKSAEKRLGEQRIIRKDVSAPHPLRMPQGLFPIVLGSGKAPTMGRLDLPDKRRDEDDVYCERCWCADCGGDCGYPERPAEEEILVLTTDYHQCSVLTENVWVCDECGDTFPRREKGDYPEVCIIEGKCEP